MSLRMFFCSFTSPSITSPSIPGQLVLQSGDGLVGPEEGVQIALNSAPAMRARPVLRAVAGKDRPLETVEAQMAFAPFVRARQNEGRVRPLRRLCRRSDSRGPHSRRTAWRLACRKRLGAKSAAARHANGQDGLGEKSNAGEWNARIKLACARAALFPNNTRYVCLSSTMMHLPIRYLAFVRTIIRF